eukprot:1161934-Pelagomonas_calceolata.AAC.11
MHTHTNICTPPPCAPAIEVDCSERQRHEARGAELRLLLVLLLPVVLRRAHQTTLTVTVAPGSRTRVRTDYRCTTNSSNGASRAAGRSGNLQARVPQQALLLVEHHGVAAPQLRPGFVL